MQSSKLTVYYAGYHETSINTLFKALNQYKIGSIIDCRCSPNPSKTPEYKLKNVKEKCEENGIKYCWKGKDFGGKHQTKKLLSTLCNNETRIAEDFLCCIFSVVKQPPLIICECKNIIHCHCRYIVDALILYNLANIKTITIDNDNENEIKCQDYTFKDTKIKIVGYIPKSVDNDNKDDEKKEMNENRTDWSKYLKSMEEQDVKAVLAQFEEKWKTEQLKLKEKLILEDDFNFYLPNEKEEVFNMDDMFNAAKSTQKRKEKLQYVAGVDISHGSDDEDLACAGIVVLEYPSLKQVYQKFSIVGYTQPYIPGFLAFREVDFLVTIIDEIKADHPEYIPQVILVDGNGILHHRQFGLASHLGVLCNMVTIGVAKNILVVDGLDKNKIKEECDKTLLKRGDMVDLIGETKGKLGVALRCSLSGKTPVYVSNGHRISMKSAINIVMACSPKFKQPEPIRSVDNGTRKAIAEFERKLKNEETKNDIDIFHESRNNVFFIEWRVKNESVTNKMDKLQKDLLRITPTLQILQSAASNNMHITMNELKLNNTKEIEIAMKVIKQFEKEKFSSYSSDIIDLKGFNDFDKRILFINAVPSIKSTLFVDIYNELKSGFEEAGLKHKRGDFEAHITVCKAPKGKKSVIPNQVWEYITKYEKGNGSLGQETLNELVFCVKRKREEPTPPILYTIK